ncbi:MAG: cytochrome c [Deltaproteobacteria bacterium]|nr:cytochrome c [Deltaproteobacteria bacterium]
MLPRLATTLAVCALVACSGATPKSTAPPPTSVDAQLAAGAQTFADKCAVCHGAAGEGGKKAPALIGPKALSDYKAAKDVFAYAKDNMPPDHPGSLGDQDYWNIVAFLLNKNGTTLSTPLNAANGGSVGTGR